LNNFLVYAAQNFEIFIFAFPEREFPEPIVKMIAPFLTESHVLYRDSGFVKNGQIYKDLEMLDREMKNVVLVDDNKRTIGFYPRNSIRVPAWKGSTIDTILTRNLPEVLEECRREGDVQKNLAMSEIFLRACDRILATLQSRNFFRVSVKLLLTDHAHEKQSPPLSKFPLSLKKWPSPMAWADLSCGAS
jgi:hypothetical protein